MTDKFCKDCKHKIPSALAPEHSMLWRCQHPKETAGPDPVTGEVTHKYCSTARLTGEACGPEGKLWSDPR